MFENSIDYFYQADLISILTALQKKEINVQVNVSNTAHTHTLKTKQLW